jgi:hypothetical protein
MIKATKTVTVAMFAIILATPFLQEHLHLYKYRPLTENRLKIPRPKNWRTLFETGTPFAKKYEEYFNDNYGMRDLLIRTKNSLDYRLFRKSEKIVIGPDNWLFYRNLIEDMEILLEKTCDQLCEPMYARFLKLNQALAARGITLVVLPCPMKNTIYPEMLPATAPRRPNPNGFDRFRRFLKDHPEIVTIDAVPILSDLKGSFRVYHKTDFHWTDPAGAYVAKELINTLGKLSGKGDLWDFPIEMRTEALVTGGENASLGLLRPIVEDALFLKQDRIDTGRGEYFLTKEANEWNYKTKLPSTDKLIPTTVMFGDSYGDALLRAGFTAYFVQLQKFSNYDFKTRYAKIPAGTRFVIFEHIEPFLNDLLNPAMWPEEFVAK